MEDRTPGRGADAPADGPSSVTPGDRVKDATEGRPPPPVAPTDAWPDPPDPEASGPPARVLSSTARANYKDLVWTEDRDPRDLVGFGKESGEIEYAADGVLVLAHTSDPTSTARTLVVAKHRLGPTGAAALRWTGTRFTPPEHGGTLPGATGRRLLGRPAAPRACAPAGASGVVVAWVHPGAGCWTAGRLRG
jgi:hypothetical protein